MNCLVWNAQGLGNQLEFQSLHRLIADEDLSLVFLCEMKVTVGQCLNLKTELGFDGYYIQDYVGKKGGLILLWKSPMMVDIQSSSLGHIDGKITHDFRCWRFTGFYGNLIVDQRVFSWLLLEKL